MYTLCGSFSPKCVLTAWNLTVKTQCVFVSLCVLIGYEIWVCSHCQKICRENTRLVCLQVRVLLYLSMLAKATFPTDSPFYFAALFRPVTMAVVSLVCCLLQSADCGLCTLLTAVFCALCVCSMVSPDCLNWAGLRPESWSSSLKCALFKDECMKNRPSSLKCSLFKDEIVAKHAGQMFIKIL